MSARDTLGARIAQFVEKAQGTYASEKPPAPLEFGRFRLFCSLDVDQITAHGGTFSIIHALSFGRGEPFVLERAEFDQRMRRLQEYTRKASANGITVISYVSQNTSTTREADPDGWVMSDVWKDEQWWGKYSDLYGPRPETPPSEWLQIGADGVYGGHVWIPPEDTVQRHYEVRGNPHSPGFRHYMGGIINVLVEAGIGGIYLDHSELTQVHSEDSIRCFRECLAARWSAAELKDRFGINDVAAATPATETGDPLLAETILFQAASEAEFHQYLRDIGRRRNPEFIIAGNLWGGYGFETAALIGSDIQLAGMVDSFLYSELATGTESPERGQRNTPGTRDGVRTSLSPLVRVLPASSRTHASTSYTYYPQAPNPIPTEEALYNVQRLAMAEAFANHTAFRRVEARHVEPVQRAAKTVYELLKSVEPQILGAEMASNVAVVASLQGCYFQRHNYHLEVSRALSDAGFAHHMLAPRSLRSETLVNYAAIVLPNTAVLSRQGYEALRSYAKEGGLVCAFGEIGTLDPRGGPGPGGGTSAGDFVVVPIDKEKLAKDNANVRQGMSGEFHAAWARGEWPDVLRPTMDGVVQTVEEAVGERVSARVHDPRGVEITVMQQSDSADLILHLVNYAVDLAGDATPVSDVRVSVATDGRKIESVEWHALDDVHEVLTAETDSKRAEFTIPEVALYGLALVKFA
ncbi:MAG: hypothetical protein JXA57_13620 [Armatimonadetes bacterium]|nr:hypothetical protein [Armatimonadota bacterium]